MIDCIFQMKFLSYPNCRIPGRIKHGMYDSAARRLNVSYFFVFPHNGTWFWWNVYRFQSLLLRDRVGTLSSSCIAPGAPATCAMTNNRHLYYKCGQPPFPATLTWDCGVRLPTAYLHFSSPAFAFVPSRDLRAKFGGVHWSPWAMAMAINAHSKLESYIREHGDLVTGELYHSW